MKRLVSILIIIVLLTGCLTGCSGPTKVPEAGYTFVDDASREVTVQSAQRVAALLGSYADIWILAGGKVCACADDAWDDFKLPLDEDVVNLGGTKQLSLEALFSSQPDLVLASTNTPQHLEWEEALEGAGIAVAYFDVACFADYLRMLKICTDITGEPERYEQYGVEVQTRAEAVLRRSAQRMSGGAEQSVLFLRASAASIRAKNSKGSILGEMLAEMGCINIADSQSNLLEQLSIESIYLENPDRIFIVQVGDDEAGTRENVEAMFRENPLWLELDAVKEGRVHYMDKRLFNLKPNARWAEAYEQLEEILFAE